MRMRREIRPVSFPMLIHALAEEVHDDCLLTMAEATGLKYTTLWRWERGMTDRYDYGIVQRLAEHYDIPVEELYALIHADALRRNKGQRVVIPDLSHRRRGPKRAINKLVRRRLVAHVLVSARTT